MTVYEKLMNDADRLIADGVASSTGIREIKFREAEDIRERAESMEVGEAERIITACKGLSCKVRACKSCESAGVYS